MDYLAEEAEEYNTEEACSMEYRWGMAQAQEDHTFRIRDLMVRAINKAGLKKDLAKDQEQENRQQQASDKEEGARQSQSGGEEPREQRDDDGTSDERIQNLLKKLEHLKQ